MVRTGHFNFGLTYKRFILVNPAPGCYTKNAMAVKDFIERNFRHFNAAVVKDTAEEDIKSKKRMPEEG